MHSKGPALLMFTFTASVRRHSSLEEISGLAQGFEFVGVFFDQPLILRRKGILGKDTYIKKLRKYWDPKKKKKKVSYTVTHASKI